MSGGIRTLTNVVLILSVINIRFEVYHSCTNRAGKIKRGQLTFLLVTSECIYKIKLFLLGINYTI